MAIDTSREFPKNFREGRVAGSVQFNEINGINGLNSIGEGADNDANWYAPGTDLFDNESDSVLATKTSAFEIITQLGNGDLIAEIEETIEFIDGPNAGDKISAQGFFLVGVTTEAGGTITIPIVRGTGSFEDIGVVQNITGLGLSVPRIFDVSLVQLEEIKGTGGDDNIVGKKATEFITGDNGNDTIKGGQGNDIIEGGRGGDIIRGGAGDDIIAADKRERFDDFDGDNSVLSGGNGNDVIYGGSKNDLIAGGNGNDLLFGKSGDDIIRGGSGFDLLNGGVGNDTLIGQGGIDVADYRDLTFDGVFGSVAGLDVNLIEGKAKHSSNNNALTWTDKLISIENVVGTSRNDRFIGDQKDNVFYGLEEVGRTDRKTEFISLNGESYEVIGDVVEYSGNFSEFSFGVTSGEDFVGGLTVTAPGVGRDILIGIEFLKFNDTLVETDSINL